jgi:hypothetical protein
MPLPSANTNSNRLSVIFVRDLRKDSSINV